uniref:ATP-dependent DNA helicase n=1 Tax=Aceria tosichella TaxID=561515 RepID=A0A6G1S7D1_9ACAR
MDNQHNELRKARDELQQVNAAIQETNEQLKFYKKKKKELEDRVASLTQSYDNSFAEKQSFPWAKEIHDCLVNVFGLRAFRGLQETVINCTMSKKDCIYVAATGSGKSLVFQLPALVDPGITLVVSPLLSLMEDQVNQLDLLGIPAVVLNSTTSKEDAKRAHQAMTDPNSMLRLIYVTPERLAKSKFLMSQIQKMYEIGRFTRLVIDEVHCCSQWGHDFRKDYKQLHIFKREFPNTPILGLTATATPAVITDIKKILGIPNCALYKGSFYRPNLYYEIRITSSKDNVDNDVVNLISSKFANQTGIIYCLSTKETEDVASKLSSLGLSCHAYHAQMDMKLRIKIQNDWYNNRCKVIVATVAFGLGINKMDVRFVIHYTISKSLENYYQETGRAGRDGQPAHCILYFRFADVFRATALTYAEPNGKAHVYGVVSYCLNRRSCRKKLIAEHFVDTLKKEPSDTSCCDNCSAQVEIYKDDFIDASDWLNTVLEILNQAEMINEKMTFNKLIDAWTQTKGPKKLRLENITRPALTRCDCEVVVGSLLCEGYLEEYFHITPYSIISYLEPGQRGKMYRAGKAEGPKIHRMSFESLAVWS